MEDKTLPFSNVETTPKTEIKTLVDYEQKGKEDIKKLHSKPIATKTEDIRDIEIFDKKLLELLTKRLKRLLKTANLTLDDINDLMEVSEVIKEKKQKIEELQKQIRQIEEEINKEKEKINDVISELRENNNLRLALISLDLLNEDELKLIIGDIYKRDKKTKTKRSKKYLIFEGERFNSITAFLETLQKKGLIELPNSKYNPKRYLESWAKQNGYTITETETEITINAPKQEKKEDKA